MIKIDTKLLAEYIVNELKRRGYVILYYEAKTSNSIYLKIDYGVGKSIRISDHEGIGKLKYKYNVRTDKTEYEEYTEDRVKRFFYPIFELDKLLNQIDRTKKEMLETYGESNYKKIMQKEKEENKDSKSSFWKNAKLI